MPVADHAFSNSCPVSLAGIIPKINLKSMNNCSKNKKFSLQLNAILSLLEGSEKKKENLSLMLREKEKLSC